MTIAIVCEGDMQIVDNTFSCTEEWTIDNSYSNALDLDPVLMAGAVGAGFFLLLPIWAAVYGLRSLTKLVR